MRFKHSFHRADEPFGVGVTVRRTRRCPNHADTRRGQPLLHPSAPLRIAITQQNASFAEETGLTRDLPQTLNDEGFVRVWRATDHLYPPRLHVEHEGRVVRHQSARGPYLRNKESR
jgi:hypothetical protein